LSSLIIESPHKRGGLSIWGESIMNSCIRARTWRALCIGIILATALTNQLPTAWGHGSFHNNFNKTFAGGNHSHLAHTNHSSFNHVRSGHGGNHVRVGHVPHFHHSHFGHGVPPGPPNQPGQTVNVRAFGAFGDGKTDDLKAFQAAVAAAGYQGTVMVPAGTYALSSVVTLNNGVSMVGVGPSSGLLDINPTPNVSVLAMTGPGGTISNLAIGVQYPVPNPAFYINGIVINNIASAFVVDHVTFNSIQQVELMITNSNSGTITNNTFNECNLGCVFFHGANNLTINNNVFNQYGDAAIEGYYPQSTNLAIDNNVFNVQAGDNYTFCIVLGGITNGTILSNQVTVPANAYFHSFLRLAGSNPTTGWGPVSNIQVAGNLLTNCGKFQSGAIEIEAPVGDPNAVTAVQITNNRITQTVIQGYGWLTSLASGINVLAGSYGVPGSINGILISNNNIDGAGYYGIYLDSTMNAQVSGNTIKNCAGTCIGMSANNGGALSVSGNSCTNSGFDTASDAKTYGISTKAVIELDTPQSGPSSVTSVGFTNNAYNGNANNLTWFIDDNVSMAKTPTTNSGNMGGLLPSYFAQ
jgi:parallel beta-helix repeat protein